MIDYKYSMSYRNPYEQMNDEVAQQNNPPYAYNQGYNPQNPNIQNNYNPYEAR